VATEDPSLIMPARFAASATGDTRFNLDGATGGIGPDGLPLQNALPTAAEQAQILRYTARWRNAKTQEERETVEGFLMMDGVDVDASNLENDEIVMVAPEERGIQFLIGFITVIKSFLDRMAKKKTDVESANVGEKDPSEMTPEEQTTEKEGNDKKLTDFKDQKTKAEGEIKDIDKRLKAVPPPEGEIKEKLETDLKNKKEEVKNIEEEIKKLEERNIVLASPAKAKEDEKDRTKQEPLQDGQTKVETLEEDPVFQEFARKKEALRTDYHEYMSKAYRSTDNENYASYMDTQVQKDFAKTGRIYDWRKEEAKIWKEMIDTLDSFIDHMTLEKNAEGKYRITINFSKMQYSAMGKSYQVTDKNAQKLMTKMNEGSEDKARLSIDGDKLVTPFMSGDELMKLKI
nr:hypothetical protein [Candidatus Peribacteraceae bacterium]